MSEENTPVLSSSKPLFPPICHRLLSSLSFFFFQSLIIRQSYLFPINILLSLSAGGRIQPRERRKSHERRAPQGNKHSIKNGKHLEIIKVKPAEESKNKPVGRLVPRPLCRSVRMETKHIYHL